MATLPLAGSVEVKEEVMEESADTKAESSEANRDPAAAAQASEGAAAGAKPVAERSFKVLTHPHLNLGLRLGLIYTESDLRKKCRDDEGKLKQLEKFMSDESQGKLMAVAAAPPKLKGKAPTSEPSCPVSAPPLAKRPRVNPAEEFLVDQVVWHAIKGGSSRLAKVSTAPFTLGGGGNSPESCETCYGIVYMTENNFAVAPAADAIVHVKRHDLTALTIEELPAQLAEVAASSAGPASLTMSGVRVPEERKSEGFKIGEVVWYLGAHRPSWPAKIQMMPQEGENEYRVQLFGTQGGCEDGEVLAASSSQLVRFEKDDMPAFYQVAKAVQDAILKQA